MIYKDLRNIMQLLENVFIIWKDDVLLIFKTLKQAEPRHLPASHLLTFGKHYLHLSVHIYKLKVKRWFYEKYIYTLYF